MEADKDRAYPDTMVRRVLGEDANTGTIWMVIWTLLGIVIVGGVFSVLFGMR
jgi:hypothetical protein